MVYRDPWPRSEDYVREEFRPIVGEEPPIEGKFRYVGEPVPEEEEDNGGLWGKIKKPFKKGKEKAGTWWLGRGFEERRRLEKEDKRAKEFEELIHRKMPEQEEKAKYERLKMWEREYKSRFPSRRFRKGLGTAGEIAKGVQKVATLGGPIKVINKELYTAPGMRKLVSPTQLGALRETTTPGYSELRGLTMPSLDPRQQVTPISELRQMTKPTFGFMGGQVRSPGMGGLEVTFSRLRGSRGLSPIEQLVLKEATTTPGPDVKADLINKLVLLGISRVEASRAIESLLRKKVLVREGGL